MSLDPSTLPAGMERQFLHDGQVYLPQPKPGDAALVWCEGRVFEVKVTGSGSWLARVVYQGRCYEVPADRVTGIGR